MGQAGALGQRGSAPWRRPPDRMPGHALARPSFLRFVLPNLVVGLILAGSSALTACSGGGSGRRRPNVVVIVMDTVRPDALSVYGNERPTTPFLERFAA